MRNSFRTSMVQGIPIPPNRSRLRPRTNMFPAVLVLAVLCFAGTVGLRVGTVYAESEKSQKRINLQKLEGRWVRPDGGYVFELRDFKEDGSVTAAYFNPKPIKVFSANWNRKEGEINLFVELRDINYPGSKYNLQYDTKTDRLKGTYFQAVEKQTFTVEFVRAR